MNLTSVGFLAFVGVAVVLYYIIPLRFRWLALLGASICFIVSENGIKLSLVMGLTVLATYGAGLILERKKSKEVLISIIALNAGVLIYLKDMNFFIETVCTLGEAVGYTVEISSWDLLAPIGISYYTLNMISYILDLYWGTGRVQKNVFKFILFAGYFPVMASGPIIRYREIEETLYSGHKINYKNMCFGAQRILWGLFKKLVISDRLAVIVNAVYGDYHTYAGCYVIVAVIFFVFQLYTDFSACIDIVMGVSEIFGIVLPENFQMPFLSRNISEFWRRWHITLGAWLKDYVLWPILKTTLWQNMGEAIKKRFGKKVSKKIPVWLGLFFSWFIIGFWHGGSWNYIVGSGLFMWLMIVLGEACEPIFKWLILKLEINTDCFSWKLFQSVRTFVIFSIGMSFFRARSVNEGIMLWQAAFSTYNPHILFDGSLLNLGLDKMDWWILCFSMVALGISGIISAVTKRPTREWLAEQNLVFRWLILYILIFFVVIFGCYGQGYDAQAFIYQGF